MNDTYKSRNRWRNILSIIMIGSGCIAFVIACVSAMIISSRE
ncbi:MAG: hypothetical protein RR315_06545 [Oscillospiraceae bacterium]